MIQRWDTQTHAINQCGQRKDEGTCAVSQRYDSCWTSEAGGSHVATPRDWADRAAHGPVHCPVPSAIWPRSAKCHFRNLSSARDERKCEYQEVTKKVPRGKDRASTAHGARPTATLWPAAALVPRPLAEAFPRNELSPCLVHNGGSPSCGYARGATVRPDCPGPQRADLLRATA
ncbi:hypothetical protein CI102_5836 [Trichoderma harzianum]|nr:hypothetical protein CI102_5836 [Trichoderma harzianum]